MENQAQEAKTQELTCSPQSVEDSEKSKKQESAKQEIVLPARPRFNEFLKIFQESGTSYQDRMTAIYMRAMKPDCFDHYVPKPKPLEPKGFFEDYQDYKSLKINDKPNAWRNIVANYSGYLKACDEVKAENESNQYFLREMLTHFQELNLLSLDSVISAIRERLNDFDAMKHSPY